MMQETQSQQQENDPVVEKMDFSKPDYSFTPKGRHDWRQEGFYVICRGCELEHAVFIGHNKIMAGVDDLGQPLLKLRV